LIKQRGLLIVAVGIGGFLRMRGVHPSQQIQYLVAMPIRERDQSARAIDAGLIRGHVLRWHKVGKDGSGKCDVFESMLPGEKVHGVVYEIAAAEEPQLD
jgi:hypothetical protein